MRQSSLLIFNASVSYGRMLITLGLGLATTHLILKALGTTDFGIYAVVISITGVATTASSASGASVQRHLAVELGRKDEVAQKNVFATAVVIHLMAASVLFSLGCVFREQMLQALNIPEFRVTTTRTILLIAFGSAATSVLFSPIGAAFAARQRMAIDATFAIASAMIAFAIALLLQKPSPDALLQYARLQFLAQFGMFAAQTITAIILFPELRVTITHVSSRRARQLTTLAGWSLLGMFGWTLRISGGSILLNFLFGPAVNTSYAVAQQATTYVVNFSNVIMRAAQPVMSNLHGRLLSKEAVQLSLSTSKLMLIATSLIAIPIACAPELVLRTWLRNVPPYASAFLPLMLLSTLCLHATVGHDIALMATSKINRVAGGMFWIMVSPLPSMVFAHHFASAPPPIYGVLLVASSVVGATFFISRASKVLDLPIKTWMTRVLLPASACIVTAAAIAVCIKLLIPPTLSALLIIATASTIALVTAAVFFASDKEERRLLKLLSASALSAIRFRRANE